MRLSFGLASMLAARGHGIRFEHGAAVLPAHARRVVCVAIGGGALVGAILCGTAASTLMNDVVSIDVAAQYDGYSAIPTLGWPAKKSHALGGHPLETTARCANVPYVTSTPNFEI